MLRTMGRTGAFAGCILALSCAALVAACAARHSRAHVASPPPGPAPRVLIGRSVMRRPIYANEVGAVRSARADLLVVGCIHGNEPAGIAVSRLLHGKLARRPLDAWLVDNLNPDGRARDTRQNARGVDLNRNFPFRWRPLGARGSQQYSGRGALSEPESRAAFGLIQRVRPRIAIWFHQPLGVVDESGGSLAIERRFSRLSGIPLGRLARYPGSAVGWENHAVPGSTAFVVELPPGRLSGGRTKALAAAVVKLALSGR